MKTLKNLLQLIIFSCLLTSVHAQELTIYVLPSPMDRSWDSPSEILSTTIVNMIYPEDYKKRLIGHVFVQLTNSSENYITGATADHNVNLKELVLKDGYGLGVLTADIQGRLETTDELSYEMAQRFKHGNISFLKFKLSPEMYERLKYYLIEYDRREYDSIYNGENKPREGKGAGCSAFAVSFLEVAGFLKDDWSENWVERVKVPKKLIGGKLNNLKVGALKVLASFKWASDKDEHVETCFYDPNSMHKWIQEKVKNQGDDPIKAVKYNNAIGLVFDYRDKYCPDEPVFFDQEGPYMASK